MITVTISSQDQIIIPKLVRDSLGIKSGDKLIVYAKNQKVIIRPMGKSIVDSLAGSLKVTNEEKHASLDEIMAITKKRVAKKLAKE